MRILIAGDFCPINRTEDLVNQENHAGIFNEFLSIIENSQLAIVNLECPLTNSDSSINKIGPSLKASPKAAGILAKAGFNVVTLANNHIMDFGSAGLQQTLEVCRSNGILCVGAGENLEQSRKHLVVEIDTYKVAIVNFTENEFSTTHGSNPGANPLNIVENYREIKKAKDFADYIIVIVHSGNEMYDLPSPRIKETFRFFAEAGASAVIGHHPHVPGGFEIHNQVPIFYSLGNFVFDYPGVKDRRWNLGYAVELYLGDESGFRIIPFEHSLNQPGIRVLKEDEEKSFNQHLAALNSIILDDSLLNKEYNEFCKKNKNLYFSYLEPHSISLLHYLRNRNLFPSFLTKRKKKTYLNLFRCESHRDVIENLLRNEL
ncbi:MAG: CapA family protein [Bacteroidales bacterium]